MGILNDVGFAAIVVAVVLTGLSSFFATRSERKKKPQEPEPVWKVPTKSRIDPLSWVIILGLVLAGFTVGWIVRGGFVA